MDFTINLEFIPIDHTESKELVSHSFHINPMVTGSLTSTTAIKNYT